MTSEHGPLLVAGCWAVNCDLNEREYDNPHFATGFGRGA